MAMRPYGIGTRGTAGHAVRQESPERAQPSLVGAWGNPQPLSAPLTAREAGGLSEAGTGAPRTRVGAPLRIWESGPWGRSEVSDPAGESREGTALFGGGLGGTPKPLSRSASGKQGSGQTSGVGRVAQPYQQRTSRTAHPEFVEGLCQAT